MRHNMDITIQPRASRKHVNITLEIIFSAQFDGYIAAVHLCVRVTRDVEKGQSVCTCNMGMTG